MKIRDIVKENVPPVTTPSPVAAVDATQEPAPPPEEIKAVQDLLGTIDPQKEQPQGLLNKLTSWMKSHPLLDKVTDIIPQTRLVKAISAAVDAIEAGDNRAALSSLASGLTGNIGKAVGQINTLANVGSNLAQGDVKAAALSAGGNVAKAAKVASAAGNLAQGDVKAAAQSLSPTAGRAVGAVQTALAPKTAQPSTTVAQDDELTRIKQLANV